MTWFSVKSHQATLWVSVMALVLAFALPVSKSLAQPESTRQIHKLENRVDAIEAERLSGYQRLTTVEIKLDNLILQVNNIAESQSGFLETLVSNLLAVLGGGGLTFGYLARKRGHA